MGRGIHWLGGTGGRGLLDWVWLTAGFTLLAGLVLRLSGGFFGPEVRYVGIAALALGIILAVLGWAGEKLSGDSEHH